jgi:hypothetical protein
VKRTLLRAAGMSAAVLLTATACGGAGTGTDSAAAPSPSPTSSTPTATATPTPAVTTPAAPAPATSTKQASSAKTAKPTAPVEAPPGDPGPDAPEMADPGEPTEAAHGKAPRTTLPADSVLDAGTVAAVAPARWTAAKVPAASCAAPVPAGAAGQRSVAYRATGGTFAETVVTYAGPAKADAAVAAFGKALKKCGWTMTDAPALGSSSVQGTRGGETVLMLGAEEGVAVVVRGSGIATQDPSVWESLADLAMGSSCPAAPDGCH